MTSISRKVGEMEFDGLITNNIPPVQVQGGTIAAVDTATTYKRGTLLAKSSDDNKLYILGTAGTLTPDCVLCDDIEVGSDDVTVVVYTAGCFDLNKIITADAYNISEKDKDKLRERGIVFKTASTNN